MSEALGATAPLVAYNHERVAVLDATSGALAVVIARGVLFRRDHRAVFAGHDVRTLYRRAGEAGVSLGEPSDDTSIMAYLVDSISGHYELADVAERFLGEARAADQRSLFSDTDDESLIAEVQQIARLRDVLRAEIDALGAPSHLRRRWSCPWWRCSGAWRRAACASTSQCCARSPTSSPWRCANSTRRSKRSPATSSRSTRPSSSRWCSSTSSA